jgi:hypothetical protein
MGASKADSKMTMGPWVIFGPLKGMQGRTTRGSLPRHCQCEFAKYSNTHGVQELQRAEHSLDMAHIPVWAPSDTTSALG